MGQIAFENAVMERLQGKHHLQPIFSGGNYDMVRRLREYDPAMFVVWNRRRQKLEVHCLNHPQNTYACDVPNNRLDARVEEEVRRGDIRIRGTAIFKEIDEHNERLEKRREREYQDFLKAAAVEMKPYFAKVAWEGV
jgi:hypothetical protein